MGLLVEGQYQAQDVSNFRYWLSDLGIGIGVWQGEFQGIIRPWLRWYDADGNGVPTEVERADRRANESDQRAEVERPRYKLQLLPHRSLLWMKYNEGQRGGLSSAMMDR